jgi:hypothetical protein
MLNRLSPDIQAIIDLITEAKPAIVFCYGKKKSKSILTAISTKLNKRDLAKKELEQLEKYILRINKAIDKKLLNEENSYRKTYSEKNILLAQIQTLEIDISRLKTARKFQKEGLALILNEQETAKSIEILKAIKKQYKNNQFSFEELLQARDYLLEASKLIGKCLSAKKSRLTIAECKKSKPKTVRDNFSSPRAEQKKSEPKPAIAVQDNLRDLSSPITGQEKDRQPVVLESKVEQQQEQSESKGNDKLTKESELAIAVKKSNRQIFNEACQKYELEWRSPASIPPQNSSVSEVDIKDDKTTSASANVAIDLSMRSQAHRLVTTLRREEENIPDQELPAAITLLHKTDALIKKPTDDTAQGEYHKALTDVNGHTNLKKIVGGIALGILGTALLAGSIALAVMTLGGGALVSLFTAKMSIALLAKAFILAGVTLGSGTGAFSLVAGVGIAQDGRAKPVAQAAHRFWKSTAPIVIEPEKYNAPPSSPRGSLFRSHR